MRRTRPCVTATLLLAAAIFVKRPAAQGPSLRPPFPPPGRLVDIGGWRLHINCTGEPAPGQPTVILEAGLGDFSVEWSLVQPRVARFARVCSYDRGGDGWSDLGPDPRTLHQIVGELRTPCRGGRVASVCIRSLVRRLAREAVQLQLSGRGSGHGARGCRGG